MSLLTVFAVTLRMGGRTLLEGADLTVDPGRRIGLVGRNGAGKSTLLKAIFGLVRVRSGEITVNGESIVGLKADKLVQRGVAFVPQNNNVFPSLSIEENLQMGLYQNPKIYNERLEFVTGIFAELGKRLKQRAGSLSGGERQMVAMSRALMMDPSVIVRDEPSAPFEHLKPDDRSGQRLPSIGNRKDHRGSQLAARGAGLCISADDLDPARRRGRTGGCFRSTACSNEQGPDCRGNHSGDVHRNYLM